MAVQGFRTLHHPPAQKDFNDVTELKSVYYPECEDLVMKL